MSPKFPGNIGSCARVAANFEMDDWVIVAPQCTWDTPEALKFATGISEEKLRNVRVVATLQEAVADCTASVGFTRRDGKIRKINTRVHDIPVLFQGSSPSKVALVFGNEETGLTFEELESCTHLCSIPTSDAMGSMNLSHAVAVVTAPLYAAAHEESWQSPAMTALQPDTGFTPAKVADLDGLMQHVREFLIDIGMNKGGNPERILVLFRGFFFRSRITRQEIRGVRGVISKAQVKLGTRLRGKRTHPTENTPEGAQSSDT